MAAEMELINVDSEEMSSTDHEVVEQQSMWTGRRVGLLAVGLTGFAAIGMAAAAVFDSRQTAVQPKFTARALFESDELIKAVAKNQMDVLKLKGDEKEVQHKVVKSLKKIEREMEAHEPAKWRELNGLELSPEHKDAMVRIVSSFPDPRVQEVGRKVAKAFADGHGEGREGVTRRLKEAFKEELPKMRQLKNELFHGLREEPLAESEVTFDVDSMRILKALDVESAQKSRRLFMDDITDDLKEGQEEQDGDTDTSLIDPGSMGTLSQMVGDSDTVEEVLNFAGGITEQTRTLLDQIDFVGNSFGWDSQVPAWAKSGVAGLSFGTNLLDCVARSDGNDVKEGMCPFKYGSAGFDMFSCLDNLLGVSNARMGVDNPGGYDIWDDVFGSPTPATSSSASNSGSSFLDGLFSSPTPAPAGTAVNTNGLFSWTG